MKLTFLGFSDDVFQCLATEMGSDEAYRVKAVHAFRVCGQDGDGLYVWGTYAPRVIGQPCWVLGIAPLNPDSRLPDWSIEYKTHPSGYSLAIEIETPGSVQVEPVTEEEEVD